MRTFQSALDRIDAALFVGRESQLASLDRFVDEAREEPRIVLVLGAGGAGKTALVRQFLRGRSTGKTVWISGERLPPNPEAFVASLAEQVDGGLAGLGVGDDVDVLVIDAFEKIAVLERFIVDDMLPKAGARLMVVITTRARTSPTSPIVKRAGALVREIVVPPLGATEAKLLLSRRKVPASAHADIIAYAAGHALALSLIASRYEQDPEYHFYAESAPDVVATLVEEFIEDAPSPLHEDALFALSMPPAMDEELLVAMLGCERTKGRDIFRWLSALSFVERHGDGLVPHALVRNALYDRLATTTPSRHLRLARNGAELLLARLDDVEPMRGHELLLRALYMRRNVARGLDPLGLDCLYQTSVRQCSPAEVNDAAAIVERWEGPDSSARFRAAFAHDPGFVYVVHNGDNETIAINAYVSLRDLPESVWRGDVQLEAAYALWAKLDPERVWDLAVARWWFTTNGYQTLGYDIQTNMMSGPFIVASRAPQLRWAVYITTPPEAWRPLAPTFGLDTTDMIIEAGGRRAGVFFVDTHNLAGSPHSPRQQAILAARQFVSLLGSLGTTEPAQSMPRPSFAAAVRAALPLLRRPRELSQNALVDARIARGTGVDGLIRAFDAACTALAAREPSADSALVLRTTYIDTSRKQEAAAAELGMPYGTYRHRLRRAIEELTEELWAVESAAGM